MNINNDHSVAGVVGLGLMGSSIVTALVLNGQDVIALAPIVSDLDQGAPERIRRALQECYDQGYTNEIPDVLLGKITFTESYADLKPAWIVMECVSEKSEIKKKVYDKIEEVIDKDVILTSNTSAIPISVLQNLVQIPSRFFGMHWAEPAYTTRFLEIVCGAESDVKMGESLHETATIKWGKEPTLVRKDIRGFITNRIMYAMYREAFHLVENGYASIEDVDRACKNDAGYWMTFCGLFRYMDITGLQAYHAVMKDLFPELSNQTTVPSLIDEIAKRGGNGISNLSGFYEYTEEEAKAWEKSFEKFSFDIHRLSSKYTQNEFYSKIRQEDV